MALITNGHLYPFPFKRSLSLLTPKWEASNNFSSESLFSSSMIVFIWPKLDGSSAWRCSCQAFWRMSFRPSCGPVLRSSNSASPLTAAASAVAGAVADPRPFLDERRRIA